ncbi:MAG: ATP synthase F1 subunit delta [Faecousia sp.]
MTEVGGVYGQALYGLAREEKLDKAILQELTALNTAFQQEPDFLRLLSSPNLSKQERCALVDNSFQGSVQPYVLNFMKILTERGYAKQFPNCVEAYREQYNQDNGILPVQAVTALPLTEAQTEKLKEKLASITGKTIELTNRVEQGCLGGVRLSYDGKCVDDTIAHRLDNIRSLLKNTVL